MSNSARSRSIIEKPLFKYSPGRFKVDLVYPNSYEAAMGSLGFQTVYHVINSAEDFTARRLYCLPGQEIAACEAEILAVSLSYELDLSNFLQGLTEWGIEPLSTRRSGPLVIAGGILTLINPRPLAPFIDIIMLGDSEPLWEEFAAIYRTHYIRGKSAVLEGAAKVKGFWVPGFNSLEETGAVFSSRTIPRHSVIMTSGGHFGEMFLVEIGRGCPLKCRFCAASHIHEYQYYPMAAVMDVVKRNISPPAQIGLISSALSDYPDLEVLLEELVESGYKVGVSSLRPDAINSENAGLLYAGGVRTLTIAPEAGSLRLRRKIGKGLSERTIIQCVEHAVNAGFRRVKMYFLIGLPGEQVEDIEAIISLVEDIRGFFPSLKIELSVNAFVPKLHTPFAGVGMADESYLKKVRRQLRRGLPGVKFVRRSGAMESAQAIISQGDENVGLAVLESVRSGISLKSALNRIGIDWRRIIGGGSG